jgi:hypothetical protein
VLSFLVGQILHDDCMTGGKWCDVLLRMPWMLCGGRKYTPEVCSNMLDPWRQFYFIAGVGMCRELCLEILCQNLRFASRAYISRRWELARTHCKSEKGPRPFNRQGAQISHCDSSNASAPAASRRPQRPSHLSRSQCHNQQNHTLRVINVHRSDTGTARGPQRD